MTDPATLDDPESDAPLQPSRLRRGLQVGVLLLLVASMVFLAWVSGRGEVVVTPIATPSPAPGVAAASRLAVVDEAGRLVTTDPEGQAVVRYGPPGVRYSFPVWSPDGGRLAALAGATDATAVHVFGVTPGGATGVAPTVVYDDADRAPFYVYWSPDGGRVTFLTNEPAGLALRIAPADAGAPGTVLRTGTPLYWAWTGRSDLLVHSGGEGTGAFLGDVDDHGTAGRPASDPLAGFRAPAASTDGRFRAYVTQASDDQTQVVVAAIDGSGRRAVQVFGDAALEFAPATDALAFVAADTAGQEQAIPLGPLRLLDAQSGVTRALLMGDTVAFFWAPDGRTIAAIELAGPGDDKVADAGPVVRPVAATSGVTLRLTFVDVASGGIRSRQTIRLGELFVNQILPYFDQYALSHRVWSRDSASIALPLVGDDDTTGITVLHADGAPAQRVSDGVMAFWNP